MRDHAIETAWLGPPQCEHCAIRQLVLFADLDHDTIADFKRKRLITELPNQRLTATIDGLREIAEG